MKVRPISESRPGSTQFEPQVRSGRVEYVGVNSAHGWSVTFGRDTHRILLPELGPRAALGFQMLDADGSPVAMPRGGGTTPSFVIGSHTATVEKWTAFEPLFHWAGGGRLARAGFLGMLGAVVSSGLAGGLIAASLRTRRARTFWRLVVDGEPAGTWFVNSEVEAGGAPWEFVAADEDLDLIARDWDRHAKRTFRARAVIDLEVDDAGLADTIRHLAGDLAHRWVQIEPFGRRRAFQLGLDLEAGHHEPIILVASIPHGAGQGRSALLKIGWMIEAHPGTGTRYYVRRFAIAEDRAVNRLILDIRSAYRALYGERLRFDRWRLTSGEAGTMDIRV